MTWLIWAFFGSIVLVIASFMKGLPPPITWLSDRIRRKVEQPQVKPSEYRPPLGKQFKSANSDIQRDRAVTAVKQLCLACLQGDVEGQRRAETALLPLHPHSAQLVRQLEIAFESLALVEKTKNAETLTSRLFVGRQSLNQAHAEAPELFDGDHRDELIAVFDEAASERLADLAILKVESFKTKALAAKTEKTRLNNLTLAKDYAAEAARHPNISTADRKRIRESARA